MVNDKVPHKCWLGKLIKGTSFQELALSSNGLDISPSLEMYKQTLDSPCGWEAEKPTYISSPTLMRIRPLNPPRSQALKKLTCFGLLDASLNCLDYGIPPYVVFRRIQFEKHSNGCFGQ